MRHKLHNVFLSPDEIPKLEETLIDLLDGIVEHQLYHLDLKHPTDSEPVRRVRVTVEVVDG